MTGVILAGGKSRRMGRDKAFIPIDGLPLVERVIRLFTANFTSVIIIGGPAERFQDYHLPHYPDIYPGSAMGGLYTGLYQATTPYIFVSACDIPYPSAAVMHFLISLRQGFDAIVAESAIGLEPLFAVYGKSCLEQMRRQLDAGNPCILDLFPKIVARTVTAEKLSSIGGPTSFYNLNTPEDLQQMQIQKRSQNMTTHKKAVSFVAKSGTGKTTLLEKVIAELKRRGYRVGVIKHDAHRFDIDHPGKDSYRLTAAGADTMMVCSPQKLALVKQHQVAPSVEELVATYFDDVDIIITEGFKMGGMPKIELHRKERSATLICRGESNDPTLLAVASDEALELDVPVLDLNDPIAVTDFLVERFLGEDV